MANQIKIPDINPQQQADADEIRLLLDTRYMQQHIILFETIKAKLQTISIRKEFFASLKRGFAGYELAHHPFILHLTNQHWVQLQKIFQTKVQAEGLENLICLHHFQNVIMIVPVRQFFTPANGYNLYLIQDADDYLLPKRVQDIENFLKSRSVTANL